MLIKLVEQLELKQDKKVENVYEEIIPSERKIDRSNSFFLSKRERMTEKVQQIIKLKII